MARPKKHPTTKALRKKHGQRWHSFSFVEGDFVDKIIEELREKTQQPKKQVITNALIYYKLFLEQNFKK